MWLTGVFSMIYFAAVCAAQTTKDVTNMDVFLTSPFPTTAAPVYEIPVLKSQSKWLDVFPSEVVKLSCQVNGSSDWNFNWYRNGDPVQDSNSVQSPSVQGSVLTIDVIPDVHSGSYICKGVHKIKPVTIESNSLDLKVYPKKPTPIVKADAIFKPMYPGENVTLECVVDISSAWEYLWYHDGNPIESSNDKIHRMNAITLADRGSYHCKAKRGKEPFFSEQSAATSLQVIELPTATVNLKSDWLDVFPGEEVEFTCEINSTDWSDRYDWTYTWYRDGQTLQDDREISMSVDGYFFNITSATQADQGGYSCKAHLESRMVNTLFSKARDVTVYEKTPKPSLSKDPVLNTMYVGETLTFSCKVDVSSGWIYQWYEGARDLHHDNETLRIKLSPHNGKTHRCRATRGAATITEPSDPVAQDVLEIPVPSLSLVTKWPDVFPTESVKFSCVIQGSSGWTYTWYRNGQVIQNDSKATLFIPSASDAHTGQYSCSGQLRSVYSSSSSSLNLKVYGKKPSVILTQDPQYDVMFAGESVSFICHVNVSSGWEYIWLKDNHIFGGALSKISISSIGKKDEGKYSCRAKRGQDHVFTTEPHQGMQLKIEESKPKPSISQEPNAEKVYSGETVSFLCKVGISLGWKYSWYRNNTSLIDSQPSLVITDANDLNSGIYQCKATRDKTGFTTALSDRRTIAVSEIPVPSLSLSTQWHDLFPTESVTLSCGMPDRSDWTYIWYRNNMVLNKNGSTLIIGSASISDRGQYNCSAKHKGKGRSVHSNATPGLTLDVYDAKPKIVLTQTPKDELMHTGDSIFFSCDVSHSSGWQYMWYRGATHLRESGNILNITSAVTEVSGTYTCAAVREGTKKFYTEKSNLSKLRINERPSASIILLTGWSEVFSTDSLVLNCEVKGSLDAWNFTWYKAGHEIKVPSSGKYIVTPQDDPEQSLYICKGIRSKRPFFSKNSDSFRTKNLLLKRRVLLSISGCIFFGIIAVFLGCIILRVIRKPVDDEVKAEEAELFLTMAQLKDRGDAPCPMVEYITDASLNAPVKEGEENGTVCSETTSLPITPQQEQDVMIESLDTSENNGGLVSFK